MFCYNYVNITGNAKYTSYVSLNSQNWDIGKASAGFVQDGGYRLVMVMAIMMLNEEKIDTYDWPLQLGARSRTAIMIER